jgi:hypothetical protein
MLMNYWGKNNIHVGHFKSFSDKKKLKDFFKVCSEVQPSFLCQMFGTLTLYW